MLHGLLAAGGLKLLRYASFTVGLPSGAWLGLMLMLLAAAALGGLVLNLHYNWNRIALPVWLVLLHAGAAVAGLAVLAIAVWREKSPRRQEAASAVKIKVNVPSLLAADVDDLSSA